MTWCYKFKGPEYQWLLELYSRMGLPILDGIQAMVSKHFVIFIVFLLGHQCMLYAFVYHVSSLTNYFQFSQRNLQCQQDNQERMKKLERKRTAEGKKKRVMIKVNRTEEQKLRLALICTR
jgi:6-phosphofructokinase